MTLLFEGGHEVGRTRVRTDSKKVKIEEIVILDVKVEDFQIFFRDQTTIDEKGRKS